MGDSESCSSKQSEFSPVQSRKQRQKVEVFNEVLSRLKELDVEEVSESGFEDDLWAHFSMLPIRYALDVNPERAEDVLMHKKLLNMARDPLTSPAVDVRLVQVCPAFDGNLGDSVHSSLAKGGDDRLHPPPAFGPSYEIEFEANKSDTQNGNSSVSRKSHFLRPLHEITISTKDKPKLLSGLTCLLSEIGLNIQEAHAFCTMDGYSLDVFVVDSWKKGIDQLRSTLVKEMQNTEVPNNKSLPKKSVLKQEVSFLGGGSGLMLPPNHVEIPFDGRDVWEIDSSLLHFEYKITTGSNGDLYKGIFQSQDVAIKIFKTECLKGDMQREFAQEVYISRKIRHKNVVQFIGACTRPPLLCIVTEFMSGGSVYDFLHKQKGVFKLPAILKVAIDVSKGMSYLHQNHIIHRDLKAANLLMDENEVVKIADFGVARVQLKSGIMTAETGTYRWMAPEVIEHKPYNNKADVFSFGVVLWELLTGKLPYANLTPLQAAVGVVQKGLRPSIPKHTHPLIVELLERCWQQEPSLRPEFSEITDILQYMAKKVHFLLDCVLLANRFLKKKGPPNEEIWENRVSSWMNELKIINLMGDSKNQRQKVGVFNEVLERLRKLDVEEANEPGFEDELWAHFTLLPHRYALDVDPERVKDVLIHKELLNMARDPLITIPAVDVRLVQVCAVFDGILGDSSFTKGGGDGPLHEITISTKDKPKHLSRLSNCLMSDIGLTIQEAHAFCTKDGYSLMVFVVDSWKEGIEQLKNTLVKKIQDMDQVPNNMNSDDN
ncbi:hypothetical protein ACJIZ3_002764 [Penstemon smallii]|uniref:non-specific serine/threonine protein kinase n=1 Tax=Penstemon smallii TaxID=265156 RepID=A0ABD3U7E2_9LAMI